MSDEDESLERALADLEMIQAAYPDEVTVDDDNNNKKFPLQFTLHLDADSSVNAMVTMEIKSGYPNDSAIQVASYRSTNNSNKHRIERTVAAIRRVSMECQQDEIESAISCCAIAFETWQEGKEDEDDNDNETNIMSSTTSITPTAANMTTTNNNNNNTKKRYEWISGKPLVDQKSTFVAHLCRVSTEQEVREALQQLLASSSKIQRASHNMVAWRISEQQPDGRIVVKHDNDDDGESASGSKLAYLLDMRKDINVLVVVSRWYGGIHLGPKRFAHITNVARILLVQCCDDNNTHDDGNGGGGKKKK